MTVDYSFYAGSFHGTLSESEFARCAVFAAAYLDELTGGKCSGSLPEQTLAKAKMAFCAVADAHAANERGGDIAAESNDGVSVSYRSAATDPAQRLYDAAAVYLASTGLLYRGVRGC